VTSGLLGLAGTVLLALGGILLVNRFDPRWFVEPSFRVPLSALLPTTAVVGGMAVFLIWRSAQARRRPQLGGDLGMVGERGVALTGVDAQGGHVFVHGETWTATSERPIAPNTPVRVREVDGLQLRVEEMPG
jgi:membrane-bound serine protease (ClpP class)